MKIKKRYDYYIQQQQLTYIMATTDDDFGNYCDECGLHPKEAGMTYDGAFGYIEMCRWCYIETLKSKVERLEKDNSKLNKSLKKKTKLIKKLKKTIEEED